MFNLLKNKKPITDDDQSYLDPALLNENHN